MQCAVVFFLSRILTSLNLTVTDDDFSSNNNSCKIQLSAIQIVIIKLRGKSIIWAHACSPNRSSNKRSKNKPRTYIEQTEWQNVPAWIWCVLILAHMHTYTEKTDTIRSNLLIQSLIYFISLFSFRPDMQLMLTLYAHIVDGLAVWGLRIRILQIEVSVFVYVYIDTHHECAEFNRYNCVLK